jgi:Enolase C-terminal domain-like
VTERIPSYYATGLKEPDDMARIAEERANEGYPRMQIKISGRPIETDIEVVRKVWERVGTRMRLAVDGNRALTARDVLRLSRECPDIPFILEQPCHTIEEIKAIRPQVNHAIYLDETVEPAGQQLDHAKGCLRMSPPFASTIKNSPGHRSARHAVMRSASSAGPPSLSRAPILTE